MLNFLTRCELNSRREQPANKTLGLQAGIVEIVEAGVKCIRDINAAYEVRPSKRPRCGHLRHAVDHGRCPDADIRRRRAWTPERKAALVAERSEFDDQLRARDLAPPYGNAAS